MHRKEGGDRLSDEMIDDFRVVDLRDELRQRGLKTSGLKAELVERLKEAVAEELKVPTKREEKPTPSPEARSSRRRKDSPSESLRRSGRKKNAETPESDQASSEDEDSHDESHYEDEEMKEEHIAEAESQQPLLEDDGVTRIEQETELKLLEAELDDPLPESLAIPKHQPVRRNNFRDSLDNKYFTEKLRISNSATFDRTLFFCALSGLLLGIALLIGVLSLQIPSTELLATGAVLVAVSSAFAWRERNTYAEWKKIKAREEALNNLRVQRDKLKQFITESENKMSKAKNDLEECNETAKKKQFQ
eukprot:TRINITY_DN11510_c0_g1_i1.p1 TRINITY_DN11510_c0_g1~~TRINITY_DN11510_c0_g1_i1.p1  ORF type:complete len:305 (-),score=71.26 TRINITY_DN11510_c0_g1_i1:132-1046(-)